MTEYSSNIKKFDESSSNQSQFDFDGALALDNSKRQRTSQLFRDNGINFSDFRDINEDRTQKSQKTSQKWNNSELNKKSFQSSHIIQPDPHTNTSIDFKTKNYNINKESNNFTSPKFGQSGFQKQAHSEIIGDRRKDDFTWRPQKVIPLKDNQLPYQSMKASKSKITEYLSDDAKQYLSINQQINYYQSSLENIMFENYKVRESTQDIVNRLNAVIQTQQAENISEEIKHINTEIQHQRAIERKLTELRKELDEDYEQLLKSVDTMNFPRPPILDAEANKLIKEINDLKSQFQAFRRDQGSLDLSTTQIHNTIKVNMSDRKTATAQTPSQKNEKLLYEALIKLILQHEKVSEDPKFLYNIKMSILKQQWILFTNSCIQIQISYRNDPFQPILTIGNKNTFDLTKFGLIQNDKVIFQNQVIASRSFYRYKINGNVLKVPFVEIKVRYNTDTQSNNQVRLFIPILPFKGGQMIPHTKRQYDKQSSFEMPEIVTGYRPIDKSIIKNLKDLQLYLPNLMFSKSTSQCQGIFKNSSGEGSLINIEEKDELININIKNWNFPLLKTLEFIFTI